MVSSLKDMKHCDEEYNGCNGNHTEKCNLLIYGDSYNSQVALYLDAREHPEKYPELVTEFRELYRYDEYDDRMDNGAFVNRNFTGIERPRKWRDFLFKRLFE